MPWLRIAPEWIWERDAMGLDIDCRRPVLDGTATARSLAHSNGPLPECHIDPGCYERAHKSLGSR